MRVGRGPERLARELRRRSPRHVRLEVASPGAAALARNPVVLDHHVTELRPASVQLPVEDHAAAAPGAERQHHHRLDVTAGARVELAVRRRVCIVFDPDGDREPLLHSRAEIQPLERDVHRSLDASRRLVEAGRDAEAERDDPVVHQLLDGAVEPFQERILRGGRRRRLTPVLDRAVAPHDPRQDLRAAEIDADDARVVQPCWLP